MVVTTTLPPRNDEMFGRKAGDYVIDRLIGQGGMGAVYSGTCALAGGKRAAIKVMHREFTTNAEAAQRFGREAVTAGAVKDLNVLDIYGAGRFAEDNRMYIVMPFIEGGSLDDLCKRVGRLPVETLIPIMFQVCSGLDAVHAVGIVHRDVKTQNILVSRDYGREHHVYIVDFGIAKLLASYLDVDRITRTRATLGTPGCMAPEQARGEPDVDARADVYSVGMVMYRALLGRMPFEATNMFEMLELQAKRVRISRPRELRPELPKIIDELIMSCLEHDKHNRPASMFVVAQALEKVNEVAKTQYTVFASGLAARRSSTPQAATFAGGIESVIARSVLDAQREPRRVRIARVAVPMAVGIAIGVGGFALVNRRSHATDQPAQADTVVPPNASDAAVAQQTAAVVPASAVRQVEPISVTGTGTTFDITNNFIYRNGDQDTGTFGGVNVGITTAGTNRFEFNTVVDNRASTGPTRVGGVLCDIAAFTAANNIVARNTVGGSATGSNAQTLGNCTYPTSKIQADVSALAFESPDMTPYSYKLTASSSAKDQAVTSSTIVVDNEGDSRPQGPQKDIGADELK